MDSETSDQALVTACIGGDVRAFGRLVERHHGAVAAVAFAITRDLATSEDIAQDTFVAAWTRLADLRDAGRVRSWLCGIARNLSKQELRGRGREVADLDAVNAASADADADAPLLLDNAEAQYQLRTTLDELPASYREPLVLFYWEDRSIEHVATALDITPQAAQKRISRARTMIGDEFASRLTTTAKARRPAKAAAASIVAILATRGATPASAAVARKAARSAKSLGLLVAEAAVALLAFGVAGVLAWNGITSQRDAGASPRHEPPTAVERPTATTAPTHAPTPPALPHAPGAKQSDASTGNFGHPASYELTVLAPTRVAVALGGGQSSVFLWQQPPAPTMTRHVKGHVLDAAGKPVAGAVVVVDEQLAVMFDSLTGDGGAITNAAGEFDVSVHREAALVAVALHARTGWSQPVPVARGAADAEIELRIPGGGGVTGNVTRGGAPIEAEVNIKAGALLVNLTTDPKGHFELPLLAPGTYHVSARPTQLAAGGTGRAAEQDITVGGKSLALALDVPTGTLVVVSTDDPTKLSTIEYWLIPGENAAPDVADLHARARAGKLLDYLVGGVDVDKEVQFHDIAAGKYTVCVERKLDRDHPLPLVCRPLEVRANAPVLEMSIKP